MTAIILQFPIKPKMTPCQKLSFDSYGKGREVARLDFDLQSYPGLERHFKTYIINGYNAQSAFHKGYLDMCVKIRNELGYGI